MTKQDLLAFIARLCLVLLFPFSALSKIFDYPSAMAQAAHGWIPLPPSAAAVLLVLGGTLEIVGPFASCLVFIDDKRHYCSYFT
jgi:DoxX.